MTDSHEVKVVPTDLGIVTEAVHHTALAVAVRRSETFLTWPHGMAKQPQDFVPKGLFYTGKVGWSGLTRVRLAGLVSIDAADSRR